MLPCSIVELLVPMQGIGGSDSYNSGLDTVTKVYWLVIVGMGDAQGYSENGWALNSLVGSSWTLLLCGREVMVTSRSQIHPCCPYLKAILRKWFNLTLSWIHRTSENHQRYSPEIHLKYCVGGVHQGENVVFRPVSPTRITREHSFILQGCQN